MVPITSNVLESLRQRSHFGFLIVCSIAVPIGMSVWSSLINNYAVEQIGFTGLENGIMQSLREVPGFLAFTAVFILLVCREQTFVIVFLAVFGLGITLTGFFPTVYGLYFTVVLMSIGFHYLETGRQSLALQWLPKGDAPRLLGKLISIGAMASFITYGLLWVILELTSIDYYLVYLIGGGAVLVCALVLKAHFPKIESEVVQRKQIILRSRYWLYYALTFFSGARRQIYVAFAGFLLVEKFGYSVENMALLLLINHVVNYLFAERMGAWIGRVSERTALTVEYIGLIGVFVSYAFVESALLAGGLYVIDHFFFVLAIAIKTYFQKIADPADIASTVSVSFTINHMAAVVIPALLGIAWLTSHSIVFLIGAAFAFCSLVLARFVPRNPTQGHETLLSPRIGPPEVLGEVTR
ncbi:MAG: MFS transporter [Gammaproteobacteria bacterium]|nr:MFS transporter [Gammaproteobacteria bacterium]